MLDFKLPPYIWQEKMKIVMQYVNLDSINVSKEKGMVFKFLNSHDGKYCGQIQCKSVWSGRFDLAAVLDLPIFICDIRVYQLSKAEMEDACAYLNYGFALPHTSKCYLLCMDDGEVTFTLLCGYVKIT